MPEGPEIKIAADKIAAAISGCEVQEIFFAFEHLKSFEAQFAEQTIRAVEPRGKALLIRFPDGWNIYSHNQLYGKWIIRNAHDFPQTKRQLRLAIHNHKKSALLYSASDIEVLRDEELADHPFLRKLGPDVLDTATTIDDVLARYRDKRFRGKKITTLLLDQRFLAGLGNYLRTEIMHIAGVHPAKRPADCDEKTLEKLAQASLELARRSYQTNGITNDAERVAKLKSVGQTRRDYRFFAFDRAGKPCYTCGTLIEKTMQGSRRFYHCPECQSI